MVAMLSITAAFAEGEKTAEVSNLEAYELNINMNKLSKALGLNINMNKLSKALGLYDDQKEAVEEIHHTFAAELKFAAVYGKKDRDAMVKRAISNDVKWMSYILNKYQMRTYLELLNVTTKNRGLIK